MAIKAFLRRRLGGGIDNMPGTILYLWLRMPVVGLVAYGNEIELRDGLFDNLISYLWWKVEKAERKGEGRRPMNW